MGVFPERRQTVNAHHARTARFVLDRANKRSRNPKGREARAERQKAKNLPGLDHKMQTGDDRPKVVLSPKSSWASIKTHGELFGETMRF